MGIALAIVVIHFIADFIFQAEEWATNKSKSNLALFNHVGTYSLLWLFASCILLGIERPLESTEWYIFNALFFSVVTFIAHFTTDYFTSRIVSKRFKDGYYGSPIPNLGAFTIIGLDQVLHYAQLFYTFKFIVG
jgi:hypothetical protein